MNRPSLPGKIASPGGGFEASGSGGVDYRSRDGRRLLGVELHAQGVRDLYASFLRMAKEVGRDPKVTRGIVATWQPRAADPRIRQEWGSTLALLKPAIASRLSLVIVRPDRSVPVGTDRDLQAIGEALRAHLGREESSDREPKSGLSKSFFEIFKILLHQFLLGRGPIAIGELMRRSGCSYPTVAEALKKLERSQELARRSNRSVQLPRFPQKSWSEVLALSEPLRRTRFYGDPTGRRPDISGLCRRLQAMPLKHIAVGGVQAARHWDPHLDLHGIPRLDVVLHMEGGSGDYAFVGRLDPALQRVGPGAPGAALAVHPLFRPEPHFEKNTKGKVDWADPVETLLDLAELRLVEQAEALIRRFKGGV